MTSPLPFATTAEIDNLLVTNPQLYSTGRSTGPKGLGTPGCELRIHQLNVSPTVGGYSWHLASGNQQYGTSAAFNPRLIAFYKPSGVPAQPHCLWPCAAGDSGSMLIANLGTQVNNNDPTAFVSDYNITKQDIVDTIIFWAQKPSIRQIEFRWKLTPFVYNQLKKANPDHTELNNLYQTVLDL